MVAVLERTARYLKDKIFCTCGTTFPVLLETRLSDQLWESNFDSETSDQEKCVCPTCKIQYNLEVTVEKRIETIWTELTTLGQFVSNEFDDDCNIAALQNRWIGDRVFTVCQDNFEYEEIAFPDGIFYTEGKEYTVQNSMIVDIWSIPDANQLTFEEVA